MQGKGPILLYLHIQKNSLLKNKYLLKGRWSEKKKKAIDSFSIYEIRWKHVNQYHNKTITHNLGKIKRLGEMLGE